MTISTYSELQTAVPNELRRNSDAILTATVINERISLCEARIANRLTIRAMEAQIDLPVQGATSAGTATGTADALVLTPTVAWTAYSVGNRIRFTAASNNTSAATVDVSGVGATAIRKGDGTLALEAIDLIAGNEYEFYYDGTVFRLVPFGGVPLPSRYLGLRRIIINGDPITQLQYMTPENFYARYLSAQTSKPKAYTTEAEHIVFGPRPDSAYQMKLVYYRRLAALSGASDTNWLLTNHSGVYLYGSVMECASFLQNQALTLKYSTMFDEACDRVEAADKRDRHAGPSPQVRSAVHVI
jgi:hypothetical protein